MIDIAYDLLTRIRRLSHKAPRCGATLFAALLLGVVGSACNKQCPVCPACPTDGGVGEGEGAHQFAHRTIAQSLHPTWKVGDDCTRTDLNQSFKMGASGTDWVCGT